MIFGHDPKWLNTLSRKMRWLAIPNIAMAFIAFQATGFLLSSARPGIRQQMALVPNLFFEGEVWRILSFLAQPVSLSILGFLFSMLFSYYILNSIENIWGSFKTTFYVLSSILLTVIFSLLFDYPILSVSGFVSTWFLAAATLFPENEIHLYFFFPIKLKYLGWLALAFILWQFLIGSWLDRFYLLTVYANYLLFFGPSLKFQLMQWQRRRRFRSQWR